MHTPNGTRSADWQSNAVDTVKPITVLLLSYFVLRLIFQQFTLLKLGFIFPSGWLVSMFYDAGSFLGVEWQFLLGSTEFRLGDSCSGTTFFSLLAAFIIYRLRQQAGLWYCLLAAYPVAILANTIRVISSIEAHRFLVLIDQIDITDQVHALVGSMVFLAVFLLISIALDLRKPAVVTV